MVLSHAAVAAPVPAAVSSHPSVAQKVHVNVPTQLSNFNLNSIQQQADGTLQMAGNLTGSLLGHEVNPLLTAILTPPGTGTNTTDCPILHLEVNPIHLNLLGLKVDSSAICLNLTATPGNGNLLGNLLCGITNLLNPPAGATAGGGTSALPSNVLDSVLGAVGNILNSPQFLHSVGSALGKAGTPPPPRTS